MKKGGMKKGGGDEEGGGQTLQQTQKLAKKTLIYFRLNTLNI